MKIYRLEHDLDRFQDFLVDDPTFDTTELNFDGLPKCRLWQPPAMFIENPRLPRGNFFGFLSGCTVIDEPTSELLLSLLERSGELLPTPYKGETFFTFNVLSCVDALNHDASEWLTTKEGVRVFPTKYEFLPHRVPETPFFKLPQTAEGEILVVENYKAPEDEFIHNYRKHNLKGLIFTELWSDE